MPPPTPTASPIDIPTLLRFLTQSACLPLALAMSKIPSLRTANLTSSTAIASAPLKMVIQDIFPEDEKMARKLHAAAKREGKKRKAGDDDDEGGMASEAGKRRRKDRFGNGFIDTQESDDNDRQTRDDDAAKLEQDLSLPSFQAYFPTHTTLSSTISLLNTTTLITNRAPLLLAFTLVLLEYTMPEQPLSSRLSLAQAVVSEGARKRARELGIVSSDNAAKAEEEGWGTGQKGVRVMGRVVRVMQRGFSSGAGGGVGKDEDRNTEVGKTPAGEGEGHMEGGEGEAKAQHESDPPEPEPEPEPALWALDLEALKSSKTLTFSSSFSTTSTLPIHQPHPARAYLLKSFITPSTSAPPPFTPPPDAAKSRKPSKVQLEAQAKVANLALLLEALRVLFASWAEALSKEEMDRRAWGWYVRVRPEVEEGKAGWGGKGEVRLGRLVELRRVVKRVEGEEGLGAFEGG